MHTSFVAASSVGLLLALAGCSKSTPAGPDAEPSFSLSATGGPPPFVFPSGCCYYQDIIVRTVVPPAKTPKPGRDNFYGFPSGAAAGQKGVVGVIPGAAGYHGGHWAFHAVTFNVPPYLLTSEQAVLDAAATGNVTITRVPSMDFRCPIQP